MSTSILIDRFMEVEYTTSMIGLSAGMSLGRTEVCCDVMIGLSAGRLLGSMEVPYSFNLAP